MIARTPVPVSKFPGFWDSAGARLPAPSRNAIHNRSDALVLHPGEGEVTGPRESARDHAAAPRDARRLHRSSGFAGPPLYVHTGFDEVFVVLEGTLTTRVGDETHEVGPGGTVFVAGDTPHTFTNATGDPLRVLVICAPGGFEDYFRGLAAGDEDAAARASARAGYAPA